ncbi:MAG: ABC transporter ATP-binding protein [Chloroflexota bacterium]|nr:ABC transporter ATP-binding protein [Chloroflexota bacterium]
MVNNTSAKLLDVRHVSKVFRTGGLFFGHKLAAVDDVSFALDASPPSILSIVGESGSGKTTLARILLELIEPSDGEIWIDGKELFGPHGHRDKAAFRRLVQPIFQNPFESFSMHKRVDTYLYETALNLRVAQGKAEATRVVADVLASVGLDIGLVSGKYPNQFSGGELQRVSVARALIPRPKVIVADEPVSMVDASLRMNLVNLFLDLKQKFNVSFVYITHDLSTAYYVSDFVAIMLRGNIVEYGPADAVLTNPVHPYTELLMQAVPQIGLKWSDEVAVPDLDNVGYTTSACKFAARCPYSRDICRTYKPPMVGLPGGRQALCFKPVDYQRVPEAVAS